MRKFGAKLLEVLRKGDMVLLALCVLTSVFGIVMVAASTAYDGSSRYVIIQTGALITGILLYLALTALESRWWGEGEFKFYIDGDGKYPTWCSTGAEDYFGGAWAFLDRPPHALPEAQCFNTLFAGYPYRSTRDATRDRFSAGKPNPNPMLATNDDALPRHGLYRWHLPDPISFKEDLCVTFQDLGNDDIKLYEREDDISTVAYWYQSEPHAVLAPFAARQDRVPR